MASTICHRPRWRSLEVLRFAQDDRGLAFSRRAGDGPQSHQRSGHQIGDRADEEKLPRPLERDPDDHGDGHEDHQRTLLVQSESLLAAVADRRDHGEGDGRAEHEHDDGEAGFGDRRRGVVDDRGERQRPGRAGQADEVAIVGLPGHHIEARQAEGDADQEDERDAAAEVAEDMQAPGVDQKGGSDAEGNDVGEGIVFLAELAGGAETAGHQAVEGVEYRGDEDREAGDLEGLDGEVGAVVGYGLDAAGAVDDGAEAEEEVEDGEQRGHHVDTATEIFSYVGALHHFAPSSAMTVRATFTFSRMPTLMIASCGKKTSTREPNLIMPTRSPRTTSSPSFLSKTMRRASSPAICLNATVAPRRSVITTRF